jgi:hypothetical protein
LNVEAKYYPLPQRQLDGELPQLQAELDVLKIAHLSQEEVITEARDLYTRWPRLPAEEKRQIVKTITERIVIGDGDVEILLYYAPPIATPATSTSGGTPPASALNGGAMATKPHRFIAVGK